MPVLDGSGLVGSGLSETTAIQRIRLDIAVNLILIVAVIAEGIKDLGKREVG